MKARKAIILAAGKGTRMGALSSQMPKPLVPVAGRALLDRILDRLKEAKVMSVVVNIHHLPDMMEAHLQPEIETRYVQVSDERAALLETGGGVKKALPLLGTLPFFVINGDALWVDNSTSSLDRMAALFDPEKMDILLLLAPVSEALGYDGAGDFTGAFTKDAFPLSFRGEALSAPYVFAGVQVIKPAQYDGSPEGAWSNVELFRKAAAAGRLFGTVIEGHWMHVGTVAAIHEAEAKLTALGVQ
ncbi:nucleotidyltransferase family protein [Kordiimonas pumila]|uniref:Nucleotidyltransferase family protein n=1 Tax=Kordiimonas pumila TaxID=2161677 RepID=A0ABV7D0Y7_9PROT|nr:nucleotidyltransferase family protein [Kordiimonas pumila]